jgi:cytoskeletal protein CcmA (bactofilin family)
MFEKKSIFSLLTFCALATATLPFIADARSVVRSGERVTVAEDQLIEGDFYVAGSVVNLSGEVSNDLLTAAGTVTINGAIGADALIIAPTVDVHGTVGDDLRIIGGTIIIAEPVMGDVFVFGGSVEILSTASIAGDLIIFASEVEINGQVDGNILGQANVLRIDAPVKGGVDVAVGVLTIGDRSAITGDLEYTSTVQLTRAQNATVGGQVLRNDPVFEPTKVGIESFILPLLALLFSVALWYLLGRRLLNRIVTRALAPSVRPVMTGTIVMLLAPFAISILLVSVLGLIAGAVLLFGYILFLILALVASTAVIGQLVVSTVKKGANQVTLISLIIGSLILAGCFVVPVVGPIVLLGFLLLTFGSIMDLLLRANR